MVEVRGYLRFAFSFKFYNLLAQENQSSRAMPEKTSLQKLSQAIQQQINESESRPTELDVQPCKNSQYTHQYRAKIGKINGLRGPTIDKLKALNGRIVWVEQVAKKIQITVVETDFESLKLRIHYGNFRLEIIVIITRLRASQLFSEGIIAEGNFGSVHNVSCQGVQYAVKNISIAKSNPRRDYSHIYKEFFLCVLSDCLECGPTVYSLFGYDIVITPDSAFFVMEKCVPVESSPAQLSQQLFENLRLMHSIKLVHCDIKPENISYSKNKQKHVFLDFGLAQLIQEETNESTYTGFLGTVSYCSQEMKKCYILQKSMYVHLYYNDLYALRETLKPNRLRESIIKLTRIMEGYKQKGQVMKNSSKQKSIIMVDLVTVLRIKFYIFTVNVAQVQHLLENWTRTPKSFYSILTSNEINEKIAQNAKVKWLVKTIKDYIIEIKMRTNDSDSMLSGFLSKDSCLGMMARVLPLEEISKLSLEKFKAVLESRDWVKKVFDFLNPFCSRNRRVEDRTSKRNQIIKKMATVIAPEVEDCSPFHYESTVSVLKFLEKQLRELRNYKIFVDLRMIFIGVEMFQKAEELQTEILMWMQDVPEKILRALEFHFFTSQLRVAYTKFRVLQCINVSKFQQTLLQTQTQCKFMEKLLDLYKNVKKRSSEESVKKGVFSQQIYQSILLLRDRQNSSEYQELIENIRYLYLTKFKKSEALKVANQQKNRNNLVLRVYSMIGNDRRLQSSDVDLAQFRANYSPPQLTYFSMVAKAREDEADQSQTQRQRSEHYFKVFGLLPFQSLARKQKLKRKLVSQRGLLFFLLDEIQKCSESHAVWSPYRLFSYCRTLNFVLKTIEESKEQYNPSEYLIQKEEQLVLAKVRSLAQELYRKQRDQKFVQNYVFNQLLFIKISLLERGTRVLSNTEIFKIRLLNINALYDPVITFFFLDVLCNSKNYLTVHKPGPLQTTFIEICQKYIEWQCYDVFLAHFYEPLLKYIEIKTTHEDYFLIVDFIINFMKFSYKSKALIEEELLVLDQRIVYNFLSKLPEEVIAAIFGNLKTRETLPKCIQKEYFLFRCFCFLDTAAQLNNLTPQVVRTMRWLERMPPIMWRRVKLHTYFIYDMLNVYRSEREVTLYKKRLGKHPTEGCKLFIEHCRSRCGKIRDWRARSRLLHKIGVLESYNMIYNFQ